MSKRPLFQRLLKCLICGQVKGVVREEEIPTARITGRAHVDCDGHSHYRCLNTQEIKELPT